MLNMENVVWPQHPLILEINTWSWLQEVSRQHEKSLTLQNVPLKVLDELVEPFDVIWLMGVWRRSPLARDIALHREELQNAYHSCLPDFGPEDVVGSPYAVYGYNIAPQLGGLKGLKRIRKALRKRGKLLMLDFVPNHVAPDHPWIQTNPEFILQGSSYDLSTNPHDFFRKGEHIFAHGKDPYLPAWPDTLQLNSFSEGYRQEAIDVLKNMATFCDGVRCDMAMLMVDRIFRQTWNERGGHPLHHEFWSDLIGAVKQEFPDFKFLAEVYWDMGWELQQQGFDYCYDKRLYERLLYDTVGPIKGHLHAEWDYQSRLVRFVENHDEARAASAFGAQLSLAAAAIALTLPGARLFHYGQQYGNLIKLPVELGRAPNEAVNPQIHGFYQQLLRNVSDEMQEDGNWRLFHIDGVDYWHSPFVSYLWDYGQTMFLVVINYSEEPQTGRIALQQMERYPKRIVELMKQHTLSLDSQCFDIHAEPWDVKLYRIEV
jgi:hypothetical protein